MRPNQVDPLQAEQEAFEAALGDLLKEHEGEFVVFKDERPAGFFESFQAAFESGLRRFGLDSVFLVSQVKTQGCQSASLSWNLAVL